MKRQQKGMMCERSGADEIIYTAEKWSNIMLKNLDERLPEIKHLERRQSQQLKTREFVFMNQSS